MAKELIKKTVEEWIDSVDYSVDPSYVPTDFALQFINFIKLVNGEQGEENKTPVIHYKMLDQIPGKNADIANMCARGMAKALALSTPVLTPTGYLAMEDIHVGSTVIDRNGKHTKVLSESKVFNNQTYTVSLSDGTTFIANEDHYHIVQRRAQRRVLGESRTESYWAEHEMTTKELVESGVVYTRKVSDKCPKGVENKWHIPLVNEAVEFDSQKSPIDAYTVGLILGDGSIDKNTGIPRLHSHVDDIDEVMREIPYEMGCIGVKKLQPNAVYVTIKGIGLLVRNYLGTNNMYTKFIPDILLYGSVKDRVAVLQGLMDTDGTITKSGHASFTSVSVDLAKGIQHIVKSLGGFARIVHHDNNYSGYYTVYINLQCICPFRLQRKAVRWNPNSHYKSGERVAILSIIPTTEIVPSKCIAVESSTKSFLIEGCIVTRNSALLAEYMFLYLAVYEELPDFGKVLYAIYVSDSIENGVKKMRKRIERRWQNSDFLQKYVPHARFTDVRWEFKNSAGNEFIVSGYGSQTGVRGTVELNTRPRLAVLDDLLSDADARSKTVIAAIEDTVYSAIDHALHPTYRKTIWSGTPFNAGDPLYKAIESGAWHVNVFPVCEKFPCAKKDFRGAWEDRFIYSSIENSYRKSLATGRVSSFNQELMLRIHSEEGRMIQESDIHWFDRQSVLTNKGKFNFYITTDFATSEATSADFSVISVWAYNNAGDWLWIDGVCKKQLMDKNVDDLFRLSSKYKPQSVGIEVSGQQGGFIPWIQNEMINRNIYFNLASDNNSKKPGMRPTTNKLNRFHTVVPMFKLGKIKFPEDLKKTAPIMQAMDELKLVSNEGFKSKHDDFCDTISMLSLMNPWKPSEEAVLVKEDKNDIWAVDIEEDSKSDLDSYII